jgi:flagellar basal-body rod modification protein FlgD
MPVMAITAADGLNGIVQPPANGNPSAAQTANSAFGLGFESLLKIVLTQLTYQDPLKPMDNFEFVSQLAQFSQIQQSQAMADRLDQLVFAQTTAQATSLLGRQVDIPAGATTIPGTVKAVSLLGGDVKLTIETAQGQTISGLAMASVSQVREGN